MTADARPRPPLAEPAARAALGAAALMLAAALLAGGCGSGHPGPIAADELAEAQTFPYYRLYWAGPELRRPPARCRRRAARLSSKKSATASTTATACRAKASSAAAAASCRCRSRRSSTTCTPTPRSGPQRNSLIRGVPATVYDEGRSIELYSGRVAIDIFSDTFAHALSGRPAAASRQRTRRRRPPAAAARLLPRPVRSARPARSTRVMAALPAHACQRSAAALAAAERLNG